MSASTALPVVVEILDKTAATVSANGRTQRCFATSAAGVESRVVGVIMELLASSGATAALVRIEGDEPEEFLLDAHGNVGPAPGLTTTQVATSTPRMRPAARVARSYEVLTSRRGAALGGVALAAAVVLGGALAWITADDPEQKLERRLGAGSEAEAARTQAPTPAAPSTPNVTGDASGSHQVLSSAAGELDVAASARDGVVTLKVAAKGTWAEPTELEVRGILRREGSRVSQTTSPLIVGAQHARARLRLPFIGPGSYEWTVIAGVTRAEGTIEVAAEQASPPPPASPSSAPSTAGAPASGDATTAPAIRPGGAASSSGGDTPNGPGTRPHTSRPGAWADPNKPKPVRPNHAPVEVKPRRYIE